jgi:hypothetical protein
MPQSQQSYRCRSGGREVSTWLSAAKRPNGAMLLHHLEDMHPTNVRPYLKRMEAEDIATVAAEAYEVVEEEET